MKVLKVISITLVVVLLVGACGYLFYKNTQLNKSYEAATQQVTQLQSKLEAVGTFADVYTVKADVKMGQEIKQEDLVLQTLPTSSIPANAITDVQSLVGSYYRIGLQPGVTLTTDFVVTEAYTGAVYERDLYLDTLPVGLGVGDYVDVRVVLPGGEEFVVFPHKRINAIYEETVKMKFDEADLWLYTSMIVDRSLYRNVGFKIYCTKYVDPGAHDKTVAYYPVRKEVVDIMSIDSNMTAEQRDRIWNASVRESIDTKLKFYKDPLNKESAEIAGGMFEEESRYHSTQSYYESIMEALQNGDTSSLVDPNNPSGGTSDNQGDQIGSLVDPNGGNNLPEHTVPTAPTQTTLPPMPNTPTDSVDNGVNNQFDDETPID